VVRPPGHSKVALFALARPEPTEGPTEIDGPVEVEGPVLVEPPQSSTA
jgi:hypothetical protein